MTAHRTDGQRLEGEDERGRQLDDLLGLLEAWPTDNPPDDLTGRTLGYIQAASRSTARAISPADQAAVDALVESGMDVQAVPGDHRERGQRICELLGLMETLPTPAAGDLLVPRTMQRIEQARQREQLDAHRDGGRTGGGIMRWSDLAAVAAMLMITFSLAMPMLERSRADAHRLACQSNLQAAAAGFGSYASAHGDDLPAVKAHQGDSWWHVGKFNDDGSARSNSAHLFLLIRARAVDPANLACPANDHAVAEVALDERDWPDAPSISFSYQNQFSSERAKFGRGPKIAILGDKNPLFAPDEYRENLPDDARSPNHAALGGQNVLMNDGTVRWITDPVLRDRRPDNIWHIEGHGQYTGTETPTDASDTFLVP